MSKQRARDWGIPFVGAAGPLNAIVDVPGIEVGHSTLIDDLDATTGPCSIRTGVTAILPRGKQYGPCFAGWYALNGNGELTGTTWIEESGFLETPILLTNTHSVGIARDTMIAWQLENGYFSKTKDDDFWSLPVVGETYDGVLNDINGFHIKPEHVHEALDSASCKNIQEGNVGGGTGMITHDFKGGVGTASRIVDVCGERYTVGIHVQSNYGKRQHLQLAGVPVGQYMTNDMPSYDQDGQRGETGSIIVIVATDAPLLPHQLKRLAARVPGGLARMGGHGANSSGDIFLAFSTANSESFSRDSTVRSQHLSNDHLSALFDAVVFATEEAIVNAMVSAETMTGHENNTVFALGKSETQTLLTRFGRLAQINTKR